MECWCSRCGAPRWGLANCKRRSRRVRVRRLRFPTGGKELQQAVWKELAWLLRVFGKRKWK